MKCKNKDEIWKGVYDFKNEIRKGYGILTENRKEFAVEYDNNGKENKEKRKRTFEGVRLMIIGNRFSFQKISSLILNFKFSLIQNKKKGCW